MSARVKLLSENLFKGCLKKFKPLEIVKSEVYYFKKNYTKAYTMNIFFTKDALVIFSS